MHRLYAVDTLPDLDAVAQSVADNLANAILAFDLLSDTADPVRRLTPVECERLQGFPDGHTAGLSDSARYRLMGNAVAVPVVEWIARRLVEAAS